jgi:hypothetical protein
MRLKIYTASKLNRGPLWRKIASDWPEIEVVARWPFLHVTADGSPGWPDDCAAHGSVFWQHDHEDVAKADVVLVYGHPEDSLRGALVEAGMGIALGKTVIVVGEHPAYGTWQFHPQVRRVPSLESARSLLRLMSTPDAREGIAA